MKQKTTARVHALTPLTDNIAQVILTPDTYIDYQAGQYLQLAVEQDLLNYSIANAPQHREQYELHIRHSPDNLLTQRVLTLLKQQPQIHLTLPFGTCEVNRLDLSVPIAFIAGGTGFAPIHAMIEHLLASDSPPPMALFWGARSQNDLYQHEKALDWQRRVVQFHYVPLISQRQTLATAVINQYAHEIQHWQFVISGPFDMAYSTRDALIAAGANPNQLFSDAFAFEIKK